MTTAETQEIGTGDVSDASTVLDKASAAPELVDKATLTAWLNGDDITEEDASDDLDYETAVAILTATSSEEVLAEADVRPIATLIDTTFGVLGVSWRKSTKSEDGKGRYAVLSCVDSNGEKFLTSCGATKVVLQVRKAELEGWLPWQVTMSSSTTSNNRTVYELVAPSEPF